MIYIKTFKIFTKFPVPFHIYLIHVKSLRTFDVSYLVVTVRLDY